MCNDKIERRAIKRGSGEPTIPVSTDQRNGNCIATDINEGEMYQDDETESMYQSYQISREKFFVIESNGIIFGGGGIKPLENGDDNICELQKMYFSKSIRG